MAQPNKVQETDLSSRLAAIDSFNTDPPENEFQRGYLTCLLDEAIEDMAETDHEIVTKALDLVPSDIKRTYLLRRARVLR